MNTYKKRILIVHGWMHSAARYRRLQEDLEATGDYEVQLYEFPGFGDTPVRYYKNILQNYVKDMRVYMRQHHFDVVIAHSMGGNVVLKAVSERFGDSNIILLSPAYKGIPLLKPLIILYPIFIFSLAVLKSPWRINRLFIKLFSLVTINKWSAIDEQIIIDVKKADPLVAVKSLFELAFDRWRVHSCDNQNYKILLWRSQKDRVIPAGHMLRLSRDLKNCTMGVFKGIGHTAVTENYSKLYDVVLKYCNNLIWENK